MEIYDELGNEIKKRDEPIDLDAVLKVLTPLEVKFCKAMASDTSCWHSPVKAYLKVIDKKLTSRGDKSKYDNAGKMAYRMMRKPEVAQYLSVLLEVEGFNDTSADFMLLDTIMRSRDKTRLDAIKEYNRLKRRISDNLIANNKFNVTFETVADGLARKISKLKDPEPKIAGTEHKPKK
jgi:hypothetical protein